MAETVCFAGDEGDTIGGYMARPLGSGPYPGVIVIHDASGLADHTKELAREFTAHFRIAIAPNLYYREGPEKPEEVLAVVRQMGGVPDARVIGDLEGAVVGFRSTVSCNDKIGCIGHCSGGGFCFRPARMLLSVSLAGLS